MSNNRVLITGANGFVGQALCIEALSRGMKVRGAVRQPDALPADIESVAIGDINDVTDWSSALEGCDVVIHLAARVHVMQETSENPLAEFRLVNVTGTEHLARSAAAAGVKRFVYISSIKVNGEETLKGYPYTELDNANPQDFYGVSKWEAEQVLARVANETGLEIVIIRPPLVYGAGVKGNFAQMISVISKGLPLPLAAVQNKRSLIYVKNLVDAMLLCASHPAAAGNTYLVSDGMDISTSDLLKKLSLAMGKKPRLFSFPVVLLRLAARLLGKVNQIERLLGSLQVDSSKIRRELAWKPPFSMDDGLKATIENNTL